MNKLFWDTHYHFNNDYAVKTLTKLNSNKVIDIESPQINEDFRK
jgi:hypothetical protein